MPPSTHPKYPPMNARQPPYAAWCGGEAVSVAPLPASGFSGSRTYLVDRAGGGKWVLKNFGDHVTLRRAEWIHAFLAHLREQGLATVPRVAPLPATAAHPSGNTLAVGDDGAMWELVEFLPGQPRSTPCPHEVAAALAALGQLHAAAAILPHAAAVVEPSKGVERRVAQAARMLAVPWREISSPASDHTLCNVATRLRTAVEIFETGGGRATLATLAAVGPVPVRVHAVLRDVWSDHVLFHDDGRVSGFIDFHAAGRDTSATDIARLLGSWTADPAIVSPTDHWQAAVGAYAPDRPLTPRERRFIDWLHASAVICGLDNWFRWLFLERRRFENEHRMLAQIDRLLAHLPNALATTREIRPDRD